MPDERKDNALRLMQTAHDGPSFVQLNVARTYCTTEYMRIGHEPLAARLLSDLAVLQDQFGNIKERDQLAEQWLELTDPAKAQAEETRLLTELGEIELWWTEWSADVAGLDRFDTNGN